MKLQPIIKYQLYASKGPLLIFYSIMFSILLLTTSSFALFGSGAAEVRGNDMASIIFIFVLGLTSFREDFRFCLANGVSRKTQFKGFIVAILVIAGLMAVIDTIYTNLFSALVPYYSFFSMIYGHIGPDEAETFLFRIDGLLWSFFLYAAFAILGYFITLVYYRSNLLMKLIVSIVPPVLLFILLPYWAFVNQTISDSLIGLIDLILGLGSIPNPYSAMLSFSVFFILFSAGSYWLMKRAPIK